MFWLQNIIRYSIFSTQLLVSYPDTFPLTYISTNFRVSELSYYIQWQVRMLFDRFSPLVHHWTVCFKEQWTYMYMQDPIALLWRNECATPTWKLVQHYTAVNPWSILCEVIVFQVNVIIYCKHHDSASGCI